MSDDYNTAKAWIDGQERKNAAFDRNQKTLRERVRHLEAHIARLDKNADGIDEQMSEINHRSFNDLYDEHQELIAKHKTTMARVALLEAQATTRSNLIRCHDEQMSEINRRAYNENQELMERNETVLKGYRGALAEIDTLIESRRDVRIQLEKIARDL